MDATKFGKPLALAIGPLMILSACGSDGASTGGEPTDPPPATVGNDIAIAATHQQFEYYAGCRNQPVLVDGTLLYPVFPRTQATIDESQYPGASRDETPEGAADQDAVAEDYSRVAPPGPGDDVGTLVVYTDGMARYESDSGMITWLTDQELTYNWVC